MKISFRIILINFAIVVLILGGSGIAFYSIMFNVLTSQQSKRLLKASNDFLFFLQQTVQDADESFNLINDEKLKKNFSNISNLGASLDFLFKISDDSLIYPNNIFYKKNSVNYNGDVVTHEEFIKNNPFIIIKSYKINSRQSYYYGIVLSKILLNSIAKKIDADIAVFIDDNFAEYSNEEVNQKFFYSLNKGYDFLKLKGNFDIYSESAGNIYFLATMYRIKDYSPAGKKIATIIFSTSDETAKLRDSIGDILIILGISSVSLSLILSLLFTSKIRKQIAQLNEATEITKSGKFNNRIEMKSNDELGDLARAFNNMLDELERKEKSEHEYADFITLINQNPSLGQIADAALNKIINTTGSNVGAIYLVEKDKIVFVSSYGIEREHFNKKSANEFYKLAIQKCETIEVKFDSDYPTVSTGLINFDIKYLLILPIIYNNKVIAILELGSVNQLGADVKIYLEKIKEQLAIGITNATAFHQLERLVDELKNLNDQYQKQNLQITQQNESLVELHKQLQEKAIELEIQKKRAEESTILKSQFLALMSHELKTPLNAILGLSELILSEGMLSEKNSERLSVVVKSSKRLMNLINDILIFSKIEAGKIEVRNETFLLDEILQEIKTTFSPIASEKNIKLLIQNEVDNNLSINSDKSKILQLLFNLIDNAIKFTEEGFVKLSIENNNDSHLIITVQDTGKGISEKEKEFIFEEFRQGDSSTTRRFGGSGLGLSICKKFVDLLNGEISVISNEGKGSEFIVNIPVAFINEFEKEEVEPKKRSENVDFDKVEIEVVGNNRSFSPILIVDDDPSSLFTLNEIVEKAGYNTLIAKNGKECLEVLENIEPGLILLDIMMPVMDGFQTIQKIKANKSLASIPVIAVSAKAMSEDKRIVLKYGFDSFISKPINSQDVIEQILKFYKRKHL